MCEAYDPSAYIRYKVGVISNKISVNVYEKPSARSTIIGMLCFMSKVRIVNSGSTKDFYKILAENGAEGFCKKEEIEITEF